jgi:hypothetical protein
MSETGEPFSDIGDLILFSKTKVLLSQIQVTLSCLE